MGITTSYAQSNIIGFEYWFNTDYANKVTSNITSTPQLSINQNIPTAGLNSGINTFNFRSFDNAGRYSSVLSNFFYKTTAPEVNLNPKIVAYEYWIDNDYANAVVVNTPVQEHVNINQLMSMNTLNLGIHNFNIRFKDNANLWSNVSSNFFYKTPLQIVTQNMITAYRYWVDTSFAKAVNINLTPNQQIHLLNNVDFTKLSKGIHEIHHQFKDTMGLWSVVIVDSFNKVALPIADFNYSVVQNCDSTIIVFSDKSIDGDTYLWNFGDGDTSTLANPTHVFLLPNIYQVSLTITDTLSGKDSTLVVPITINSLHTTANITDTVCNSYIAPDGQTHTTSGIKTATIKNTIGCDSIITINLTVLKSTSSTITENACYSYTAPDGQVYTTTGVITAIIPNAASCDSTITINLTINKVDTAVTQNGITLTAKATGATYQWLDCNNSLAALTNETKQSFTATQNGSYAVKIIQNTCIDTSACFVITNVGVLKNTFSNDIVVYPNPTSGFVTVNMGKVFANFSASLHDLNGKLISQSFYKSTKMFSLHLEVPSGVYLLTINDGNSKATIRLIKQ